MDPISYPPLWTERVGAFATAVGKTIDEISEKLKEVVGEPTDEAAALLADVNSTPTEDLKRAFEALKIPSAVFNKHVEKLRGPAVVISEERTGGGLSFDSVLPTVPDDTSFLESLKIGGVPKVGNIEIISGVKAALANKLHLFDLPDVIKKKMETYAEDQQEPVGEEFFKLQKLVASRNYADVLSALNVPGNFMNEARKNKFLSKLDELLWDALHGFNTQLMAWQQSWMQGAANPAAMMTFLVMGQAGKSGAVMPPGMMTPPETSGLHDEAEAVINSINKVFGGLGIPVAKALAYDAIRIKEVIENPALPAALGATNREQMIKMLGIGVGADIVRLERNVTRFALSITEFNKITVPNEEYAYLGAMLQLGAAIPWEKLNGKAGIGKTAQL